jgi:hypothetical protein
MAFEFNWTPRQNLVDDVLAEDVNSLATGIQDLGAYVDDALGDIETLLAAI